MQRNFFITDLMNTGDCMSYEHFLNDHTLPNQHNTYCSEWYRLHLYDVDSFDRRFAIIDRPLVSEVVADEYIRELKRRVELLHSQGFHFILATPWESDENIKLGEQRWPKELPGYSYTEWSGGTSWFWHMMYYKHKDKTFTANHKVTSNQLFQKNNFREKKYNFLYLNKFPRNHRVKLYHKLEDKDLLKNSLHTFIGFETPIRLPAEYELPWVDAKNYPYYGMDQDLYEKPYNDTGCSIISETNDNDTDVFITEKLWKPILCQHIFLVHGNHLYLQKIRDIGFKTFNNYFDESYDLEQDPEKRIDKIVELCNTLSTRDWQDLYLQTQALRQHNFDTFWNKEKLSNEINKTLISFLEFADSSQVSS